MELTGPITAQPADVELFAHRAAALAVDALDAFGRPDVPIYGERTLGAVLPGVAAALGVPTGLPALSFPASRSACVVLLDGLGLELLADAGAEAPFLSGLLDGSGLLAGCPTTTATSMGSFGTGLTPGVHGLLGYEVLDPDRGVLLNELKWDAGTDPLRWQPHPTVFGTLVAAGVEVTRIGNPEFRDSGLTAAALRGGNFIGAKRLHSRVDAAVEVLGGHRPALAYLYWGDVDAAGHAHGWRSPEWRRALRHADREMARLARKLPKDTLLVLTADHGMVDVPHRDRVDLAEEPVLARGVRLLGGESRFAQLYCEPGAAPGVMRRMAETFGDRAWVLDRAAAIAAGWFGPVTRRNLGRIGDVLVAAAGSFALVDSRTAAPQVLRLIGQHGSLTTAEQRIPLLSMLV
jgi:hypothetical protein